MTTCARSGSARAVERLRSHAQLESGRRSDSEEEAKRRRRRPSRGKAAAKAAAVLLTLVTWPVWGPRVHAWLLLRSGLVRAPLEDGDCRQLLIVGAQSSGTSNTAHTLRYELGLEVAHENSDASFSPCRDGTVSWIHGMRLLAGDAPAESVRALCSRPFVRLGFYKDTFRWPAECPSVSHLFGGWFAWDECLAAACERTVRENWGCARRAAGRTGGAQRAGCPTPFARTLLQVRHPLRTVASLCAKFCAQADVASARIEGEFATAVRALLPAGPWAEPMACLAFLGWYWVLYNEAMLGGYGGYVGDGDGGGGDAGGGGGGGGDELAVGAADDEGALDGWYRVEGSDACQIAARAGIASADQRADPQAKASCVHPAARQRVEGACAGGGGPAQPSWLTVVWDGFMRAMPLASLPGVPSKARNRRNTKRLRVSLAQIAALDPALARRMLALGRRLGYDDLSLTDDDVEAS